MTYDATGKLRLTVTCGGGYGWGMNIPRKPRNNAKRVNRAPRSSTATRGLMKKMRVPVVRKGKRVR